MRLIGSSLLLALSMQVGLAMLAGSASAADPKLPPGQDPGGLAIALIGIGLDYQSVKVAGRLARDGEGEMIAWDFVDNDRTPYAPATATAAEPEAADGTTEAAALLAAYARGRLVPVRVPEADAMALAKAIGFATATPARVVAISVPLATADMRRVVREASARFKDHLFVVAAPLPPKSNAPKAPLPPASATPAADALGNLGNVLVVAAGPDVQGRDAASVLDTIDLVVVPRGSTMFVAPPTAAPRNGAEAVALAAASAACQGHGLPAPLLGSAAKAATLEVARPLETTRAVRVLDPMCWYGGKRM
jgi:hypothetical protein